MTFKFIDLFAGIGGFRMALDEAGGTCVYSNEIDKYACMTYEANFGEDPYGDITQVRAEDVPAHDILVAGFPCQPFSLAGVVKYQSLGREHGLKDKTKGTLFFDIVRILEHHRPDAFLLENVKNLKSHDKGRTWEIIMGALENDLRYHVQARVLDARLLVPQHRERVFIIGFREPLKFEWPELEDRKPKLKDILENEVDEKYTLTDGVWRALQRHAERHRKKGQGFGYGIGDPEGTSRTLSARYYKDGAEILIAQKGKNPRRLTPRECARLQGFPDDFEIPVSDTQAYRQFGNSVAVPLVEKLAEQVVFSLRNQVMGSEQLRLTEMKS